MTNATDHRNGFEKRARTRKVRRICNATRILGEALNVTTSQLSAFVAGMDVDTWDALVSSADCLESSGATRRRVVHSLRVYRSN